MISCCFKCSIDSCICYAASSTDSIDLEFKQPEKVKFYLRLGQSKPIYEAFNAIRNSSDWDSLSDARKRVVEGNHLLYICSATLSQLCCCQ